MWSVAIVVIGELGQHRAWVTLVDHDQVIETFSPNGPHDPLGDGGGRPRRCPPAGDTQARKLAVEFTAVDGIPVVDEVLGPTAPGRRLQELVPDPGSGRTGGDVEVDQISPLVIDAEEDVEGPEGHGLDHEEVGRPDATKLVRQEGSPALAVARPQPPPSVPPDGTVAHHDAELQQLAADAFGSPERILVRDPSDERFQFGAEVGSTEHGSRLPGPIESPALPVPAQNRLRLDHTEMPSPAFRPEVAKPDPEDSIRSPKVRMRVGAQCDLELMAEDQVFEREISARSNGSDEGTKHKQE